MVSWLKGLLLGAPEKKKNLRETDSRNHPCAGCKSNPSFRGRLCEECQIRLDLWCPCGSIAPYEIGVIRAPMPDYIVSDFCNRCGYRIKVISDAIDRNDDVEVDRLIAEMEATNDKHSNDRS